MFRFSSFQAHLQNNKQKKTVQSSSEVMAKAMQDVLPTQVSNDLSYINRSSNTRPLKGQVHRQMNINGNHLSNRVSVEHICRSADLDSKFSFESQVEVQQTRLLKKNHSVASGLHLKESLYTNRITEYDGDSTFSLNGSNSRNESPVSGSGQDHDIIPIDQRKNNQNPEFQVSSALANDDLIFSVGNLTLSDKDALEISKTPLSAEFASNSANQTSGPSTPSLVKSHSLPDFIDPALSSGAYAFKHPPSISRSSDDLHALGKRQNEVFINESDYQIKGDQERENDIRNIKESHMDYYLNVGVDSYLISGSPKDWVMSTIDEMRDIETLRRDSSSGSFGEYPNNDFKVKRIEDWVVGLQHCGPALEIINELPESVDAAIDVDTKNGVTAAEVDHKVTPGTEIGEKYISYMSADATTANLANHRLVVIPSLSVFVSLKVLNLSGNAIVRITTGSLPRGLHVLNLSKNNISTIEGLRELTRLRAIDLSFNRIVRIGHGLASCSSLKELYLAGNKISEVEGLHRLLKLSILDLRFNKFSTAKCLGQLAANYNSLQAISLEGNPAQKNVGDEQLKKYLQGLLPHLVYYNRQPTKARTCKDEADRSVLLGKSSYQFDRSRSLRADRNTTTRKGSRPSNSSTVGRNQRAESQKLTKGKQIQPPPSSGTIGSTQSRNHFDDMSEVLNSTSKLSISKSRSEGNQGSFHNDSPVSGCGQDHDIIPTDHCKKNQNPEFKVSSALANDDLIFSVGDLTASNKDALEISDTPLSAEFASDSADQTSGPSTPSLVKSHSLSDFIDPTLSSGAYAFKHPPSISRSSNDLDALGKRQKDVLINESDRQIKRDREIENDIGNIKESHMDNYLNAGVDSYLISGSPKDWVMPTTDETRDIEILPRDSSSGCFGEYPNKDFKVKRIEDWVVDLQHCGPSLEIINELPESIDPVIDVNTKNGVTAVEVDHKVTPGTEAGEKYISYVSADATTANLTNLGLVVIPSLSAFVSLKVINLSGNAIARITTGSLPRGLHVLNLSKNNISTIEGLRELTHLRAIDLSFNRIVRIGHGLASCSSLKELYLAGNKISEVEGLHRLLKLSILDFRFNKFSTAKCLGQLAANYNSLQAISLEGNPAQKNVGDEQLKKYLQGLLPHLVYYNRQPTKARTWKDEADRSVLLGKSSYQFDRSRSLRADRTTTRKGSRPSNSSTVGRNQRAESQKLTKGKQIQPPPSSGTIGSTESRNHFDDMGEVLNSTSKLSISKSHSEGNLGSSHNDSPVSGCGQDHDIIPTDHCKKNQNPEFKVSSALANDDLIFSVGDLTASNKDALEISDTPLSAEFASDSADQTSGPSTPSLVKSHSLSDFIDPTLSSGAYAFKHPPSISRSSNDLDALGKRQKDVLINESDRQIKRDREIENDIGNIKESHMDNYLNAGVDSYLISGSPKDWVMPTTDETRDIEILPRDSSSGCFGEYPNKDFKVKRIEDWVVDLQHCGPSLEIINELPESIDPVIDVNTKNGVTAVEVDHKVTPGTEAGEKYISYVSADATTANLTNLGLVVIPSLSAFVSLKVINLSGNAIARITTGSLPRGLHVLNLSKNNISTIEGLRELTHLRAIDLSFNRIVRIGHGLASCSSLKELYLAGNKISEVEGLHRLLKLSILDFRFNKFSTAKCLGQLAANYNSLQAISLEGNPAQKNVGDEQLKKYLQGLLPHLVYYNRQPTKARTWKDEADRSVLLGKSSYQFDRSRSLRADRTTTRKGSRPSNSSTVGRNQRAESQKLTKGKQIQPPPSSGTIGSTESRNHFDDMGQVLNSTSKLSISKSHSEGNLGSSHNDSPVSGCGQDHDIIPTDHCKKNQNPEFKVSSALANDDLIFSVGDLTASNKDALEISDTPLSAEFASDSADQTSGPSTPSLVKSHSLSDFIDPTLSSGAYAFKHPPSISRSSNDLDALGKRQKDVLINESDRQIKGDQERENDIGNNKESHMDNYLNAGFDSYLISGSPKDWVMPTTDETRDIETLRRDSSSGCFGEYPNNDFNVKRIEDWVVDLQHRGPPLEIINELPESIDPVIDVNTKNGVTAVEVDHKVTPGMGDAEKYISYLSADATTANLANLGLVVIPSLSAFVSLKVLNLSRNAIVKITALPRGLHVLNLSKNNISTIEGLRELTRLHAIDLSFNRIVRIDMVLLHVHL